MPLAYISSIGMYYYQQFYFTIISLSEVRCTDILDVPRVTCKFNVFARAYVIPYYRPDAPEWEY